MRVLSLLLVLVTICGCKQHVRPEDISKLNGYWQIEKVILADGSEKPYIFGGSYDYFEIKGKSGFRRKAVPNLDGTFQTNDVVEKVEFFFERDRTLLKYTTSYAKWQEELLEISPDAFAVVNAEHKEYHYKRTKPIRLEEMKKADIKPIDSTTVRQPSTDNRQPNHAKAPQ